MNPSTWIKDPNLFMNILSENVSIPLQVYNHDNDQNCPFKSSIIVDLFKCRWFTFLVENANKNR